MEKYIIECISHIELYARMVLRIGFICIILIGGFVVIKSIITIFKKAKDNPLVKADGNKVNININFNLNIFSKNKIKKGEYKK